MTTVRLIAGVVLLVAAALLTASTIEELSARRAMRFDLAEISHVKYGMLNATVWVEKLNPILDANIDALDLRPEKQAGLRSMVQNALYRLLDQVKESMSKPAPAAPGGTPAPSGGGFFSMAGNPMVVNLIVGALKPKVPEFTDIVMRELGRPESKEAIKGYIKGVLAEGAKNTFGNLDLSLYSAILAKYGAKDAAACQQEIGRRIAEADHRIDVRYLSVLGSTLLAFVLLLTGGVLRPAAALVLLLFSVVLLVGGIFTPMLEVEAKITGMHLTFLGKPIAFSDQVLYFQSKSVLEVFKALIDTGKVDMYVVGVLVLTFCIIFPTLKLIASVSALFRPVWLRKSRILRFFALESSKWSMADVFALAIFMSFVAFNGLIPNTMRGLLETGADIRIPTDSSKILPGYHIFIAFCLASLFLSRKLGKSLLLAGPAPDGRSEDVEQESRAE